MAPGMRAAVHAAALGATVAASTRSSTVPSMGVPIVVEVPIVAEVPITAEVPIVAEISIVVEVPIAELEVVVKPDSKERVEIGSVVWPIVRSVPVVRGRPRNGRCRGYGDIHAPRQQLISTGCDQHPCIASNLPLKCAEIGRGRVHEDCGT